MGKVKMKWYDWIAVMLLIIGGLNWGSIGIAGYNFVETILRNTPKLLSVVYTLVGASSLYALIVLPIKALFNNE
jgi:uncharacterized membrane protein YuzA (DUF378 family)